MSLDFKCEVCGAGKGQPCVNTINPEAPLPFRAEHLARVLPPGRSKPQRNPERNEAAY